MKPFFLAAAALLIAAPAAAQSGPIVQAIAAGQAGERFDGYMGATPGASPEVRRQVGAINILRRSLYVDLSSRRNVTVQLVGIAAGCERLAQVGAGQSYMLEDGVWRRLGAGETVTLPAYCR